jgi:Zn-dependent protease
MSYEPLRPEAPLTTPAPPPAHYPPSYTPEPAAKPPWFKRAGGALVALALIIFKFGAKLKGLALLLPKLKLFTTSASMLVSIGAYSLIWGWKFALGFVLLLLVHEYGHVIQLRREGIPATAPLFIPFLGAVVGMKRLPDDAAAEARVGLAGPILGSAACLVPTGIWLAGGDDFWQALAFTGFFLNLFNLLPVLPLDGGRAMAALSPKIWVVGFLILVATAVVFPNPIILIIVLFGGLETWRRWRGRKSQESQRYYRVKPATRVLIACVYIGLAAALAAGMGLTHLERDFGDA